MMKYRLNALRKSPFLYPWMALGMLFAATTCASEIPSVSHLPQNDLSSYWRAGDFKTMGGALNLEAISVGEAGKAKIVVYRVGTDAVDGKPAQAHALFINGDYQASLLPNGYTVQQVCEGVNHLAIASSRRADRLHPRALPPLNASSQKVYFFEDVQIADGVSQLQARDVTDLKLVGRLQQHTISRYVPKNCVSAQKKIVPQTKKVVLDGNGFFDFNQSGMKNLQTEGRNRLTRLVEQLKTDFVSITSIQVDGYTDRFGSPTYNERLSLARANTVKQFFIENGIDSPIATRGLGSTEPLVVCPGPKTPEVIHCLYPNRRINVLINGVQKLQ